MFLALFESLSLPFNRSGKSGQKKEKQEGVSNPVYDEKPFDDVRQQRHPQLVHMNIC